MRALRRAVGAPERGAASVELIGVVATLLVVASMCVQGLFLAQIGAATEKAVRDGARAATLGHDVRAEVERQLPSWAHIESLTTGTAAIPSCAGRCVRLEVRVPLVLPGITSSSFTLTRDADLPEG